MSREHAIAFLRETGRAQDDAIDLARTALALAALARPTQDLARAHAHLDALARDVAAAGAATDAASRAAMLRRVLVEQHGYRGDADTYDDLANADLAQVIERRRGLPVALSILWLHAGRAQGWAMAGLNFPGHFVIRIDGAQDRAIIDPFNAGRILSPADLRATLKRVAGAGAELRPEHTLPVSNRSVLLRLENNIKARLVRGRDLAAARLVLERMLMLAPAEIGLWLEAGALDAQLGNLRAALLCLDEAARLAPDPAAKARIARERATLRTRLN
jgi:regulator of sirC expression with transglutaminase-like and TPR domain